MKNISRIAAVLALIGAGVAHAEPMAITLFVLMPGDKAQQDEFNQKVQSIPFFANAKDENGTNVALLVSVSKVPTTGGAAASATSGLLAASTLGIIPVANNQDVSVHYELRVNTIRVAAYDYSQNFTSVSNLWSGVNKLPDDARAWILSTVDEFGKAVAADKSVADLQSEYDSYFRK